MKKDVAAGGELLELRVHVEEKESLFSIVGDPASLMRLQEKSNTSRSVLKLATIAKILYMMHLDIKYIHNIPFNADVHTPES